MTDVEIVDLYFERSESAIDETAKQYGSYCAAIAMNILHNKEDADECVNDAYLKAWNAIPPQRPASFSTFIGRITRNLSLDKYEARKTQKRGGSETTLLLSELENCIPSAFSIDEQVDVNDLAQTIDSFLTTVNKEDNVCFVLRYFHYYSIAEIAARLNANEGKIAMKLHRTRKKLKIYLEKRGITL